MSVHPNQFEFATTAQEVVNVFPEQVSGRLFVVTGANIGLGQEASRALASKGGKVVMCSRSIANGEAAVAKIKEETKDADVECMQLDLGDLASIEKFAKAFTEKYDHINVLINNAGIMACPKSLTKDGFESQFGVCHIGHFYLTKLLMPLLIKAGTKTVPSRVVNLSSMGHWFAAPEEGVMLSDINGEKSYHPWQRYGSAKLANILMANEITTRYSAKNVIGISVHPGFIAETNLSKYVDISGLFSFLYQIWQCRGWTGIHYVLFKRRMKTIPQGASTTLVAALDPNAPPSSYWDDCHICSAEYVHEKVNDKAFEKKLWEESEAMIEAKLKK